LAGVAAIVHIPSRVAAAAKNCKKNISNRFFLQFLTVKFFTWKHLVMQEEKLIGRD
jgi:hypothetical protein